MGNKRNITAGGGSGTAGFAFRNMRRQSAIQRKQAQAITRRETLSADRIAQRAQIHEQETQAAAVSALQADPVILTCRKSGAEIAVLAGVEAREYHAMPPADRDLYQRTWIHPRWLNTSPDNLRRNQLHHPHEFAVYAFAILAGGDARVSPRDRRDLLARFHTWPLASVIEFAELARRALALFGRHESVADSLDCDPRTHDAAECVASLHEWIAAWIAIIQRRYHAANVDRQRVITLADVKAFTIDLGIGLFRESRIGDADDYALLADVSEIFAATDLRDMRAAVQFRKPRKEKPGLFDHIDFLGTDGRGTPAPEPAPRPAALRFSTDNATRRIQLFATTTTKPGV